MNKTREKLVKIQTKGMVTIPAEFREALDIDERSILQATMMDGGVFFIKMTYQPASEKDENNSTELYSDAQIKTWLKEDKLDAKTAAKLKKILTK